MESLAAYREYLQSRGASERTVRAYLTDITMTFAEIQHFEASEIEGYLSLISGRGTARSTVARKLAALRSYGDYLVAAGSRPENPAQRVAAPHRSLRVASDDYSRKRDRTLVEVARASGLSAAELVALNAEDVDWVENIVHVPTVGPPKRGALGPANRLLKAYLGGRGRGPIFLAASGDRMSQVLAQEVLEQQV